MKYPNFTAEFEAVSGCPLSTLASVMNVTEELLTDILYKDESFSFDEGCAAFRAFRWSHRPCYGLNNCLIEYLFAPRLSMLNPRKPKNRYRLHILKERLSQALAAQNGISHGLNEEIIRKARRVIARMSQGERVTYAECRNSMNDLAVAVANYRYWSKPPRRSRTLKEVSA